MSSPMVFSIEAAAWRLRAVANFCLDQLLAALAAFSFRSVDLAPRIITHSRKCIPVSAPSVLVSRGSDHRLPLTQAEKKAGNQSRRENKISVLRISGFGRAAER